MTGVGQKGSRAWGKAWRFFDEGWLAGRGLAKQVTRERSDQDLASITHISFFVLSSLSFQQPCQEEGDENLHRIACFSWLTGTA